MMETMKLLEMHSTVKADAKTKTTCEQGAQVKAVVALDRNNIQQRA